MTSLTRNLMCLLCIFISLGYSCVALAEEEPSYPKSELGLQAGVPFPTQKPVSGVDSHGTFAMSLDYLLWFSTFAIGLRFQGNHIDLEGFQLAGLPVDKNATTTTLLFLGKYMPWNGIIAPYGLGGIGFNIINATGEDALEIFCNVFFESVCEFEGNIMFAAQAGAGLELKLNSQWAISSELTWLFNKGRVKFKTAAGNIKTDFDGSTWLWLSGIRYYY